MKMQQFEISIAALFAFGIVSSNAFITKTTSTSLSSQTCSSILMAPGGWGIGPSKDINNEEFAKTGSSSKPYEGYGLEDPLTFSRRVREERQGMKNKKAQELLQIAKMAGIGEKEEKDDVLDLFDDDIFDDEDDIDVRVEWDDDSN